MGVGGKIFDELGNPITSDEAIRRSRLGLKNTFVGDPFPKGSPGLSVVQGGSLKIAGGPRRVFTGKKRTSSISRTPEPNLPDFAIDDSIEKGSSFFPSQSPNRAVSSVSLSDTIQVKKDRFCKIVVKKGKRVRVCKVRTPKKKTKKSKSKPIKSIFDLSF